MPDRHWMEKWSWRHEPAPATLVRKKDGKEATGWKHASEIEANEKNITVNELATNPKYNMVPLSELYPDDTNVREPVRLGERREKEEVVPYSERIANEDLPPAVEIPPEQYAVNTTPEGQRSRGMFALGWGLAILGILAFLVTGNIFVGLALVLGFFAGVSMAHYIVKK